nr:MAG TPA: hypothetical protein [Caudoviricetes sp.]
MERIFKLINVVFNPPCVYYRSNVDGGKQSHHFCRRRKIRLCVGANRHIRLCFKDSYCGGFVDVFSHVLPFRISHIHNRIRLCVSFAVRNSVFLFYFVFYVSVFSRSSFFLLIHVLDRREKLLYFFVGFGDGDKITFVGGKIYHRILLIHVSFTHISYVICGYKHPFTF